MRASEIRALFAVANRPEVVSLAGGMPFIEGLPLDVIGESMSRLIRTKGATALQYGSGQGEESLRERILDVVALEGIEAHPDDIVVTTGSQQALTLIAASLLGPGAVVAVEEPTYLAALQCFRLAGARVVPVAGDEHGIVPEALAEVIQRENPALLYLVPTFANPTGRTLTARRRAAVAELAVANDLWVVEDDPYGELRYRGASLPPLAAGAESRVINLGSLSKICAPGLRLGWLRAPASIMPTLVIAKQAADLQTSTVDQAAAASYLAEADLESHLTTLRDAYRTRRDTMIDLLPDVLPAGSRWTDPDGGMFIWVRLPDGADSEVALRAALREQVAFVPGTPFYATDPDLATLRLCFTTTTPAQITTGLGRLATALVPSPTG